jgi:hypothetical protein
MSDNESNHSDGRTVAFAIGFVLGVLVTLGGSASFFVYHSQRAAEAARMEQARTMELQALAAEARAKAEEARAEVLRTQRLQEHMQHEAETRAKREKAQEAEKKQ